VLTISAEDDAFGTAARAREIAAEVADGRAIIFPRGGHALIGIQADAVKEITAFLRAARATR
jgi:pimeloyl-ACP methyl ester carboxylesterase